MKRLMSVLLLLMLLTPVCFGETDLSPVIRDDLDLITDAQEALLREEMLKVSPYGRPVFWTTDERGEAAAKAERFYRSVNGKMSGVLFMIDMKTRMLYIFSDGAVYRTVTRAQARTITDNVYRYASREDYSACALEAFRQINALLAGEKIARPMKIVSNALLSLAAALLAACLVITRRYRMGKAGQKTGLDIPVAAAVYLGGTAFTAKIVEDRSRMIRQVKTDISSDSGGGSSGGGGGGGGGGGSSGGGGGHGF